MRTVNKTEIKKFNKLAAEWWDPEGSFKPLHKFNPIRIKYIKESIINYFNIKAKKLPLKNINILVISTSEIKISVLIDKKNNKKALAALHREFKLEK